MDKSEPELLGVGQGVPQDWDRLATYLDDQGIHMDRQTPPRQFSAGYGNLNYRIIVDGKSVVLRRPPLGKLPPGANDMSREYRITSVLWRAFPLAPRGLHYCANKEVLGAPFLLMQYRPGLIIRSTMPPALGNGHVAGKLGQMMVRVLADLHRVDPAQIGLETLGRPEGFLARTIEGWATRAHIAYNKSPPPIANEILSWLRDHTPADGSPTLLHNDFKLNNIVLNPGDLTASAVLDWDMGTRGDPLFDVATLLSYWTEPPDPPAMHALEQMPTAAPGFPSRRDVVDLYAALSGRDLSDFLFYRILAMFKLAVVFHQLHARYRQGTTSTRRFATFGQIARGVLDFTYEIVRGRAF